MPYSTLEISLIIACVGLLLALIISHIIRERHLSQKTTELKKANQEYLESNARLKQAHERISLILETAHDAFIAIDARGAVIEWNRQAEKIFGHQRSEVVGQKLSSIIIPVEYRKKLENDIMKLFANQEYQLLNRQIEVTAIHSDGHQFPAEMSISVYRHQDSYFFNAFVRDITKRKKAEEGMAKRAEELARSNAELEQFAYIASHDLQEPLRMVSSFTQLLAKKFKDQIDDKANEYVHYIVDGAGRMQKLINDLLEYSRVGTKRAKMTAVDCEDVLKNVLDNLKITIKENQAEISHDALPTIKADMTQIIQLFQNIIGNAIKFRGDKTPKIHISAKKKKQNWLFCIADNGIGIDPQYSDRIFAIFQRLHGAQEYPGTGIGLAVCKKIVELHKGKIWIESEPNEGTSFYFTFPVHEEIAKTENQPLAQAN